MCLFRANPIYIGFIAIALALTASTSIAQNSNIAPLKLGVVAGASADTAEIAAAEAQKQGLVVEVIEFTDFTTPNAALDAGDLDANFFQHQAFLENAIKERGFKLQSVGLGVLSNYGLYAHEASSVDAIKTNARVGIYNDVSNQARALVFLQSLGLISLRANSGPNHSIHDVEKNPKKLQFIEVEGTQLTRSFADVDVAILYPFRLVLAGQAELANQAIAYTRDDDIYYAGRFVTRDNNTNDERVKQFIDIYQNSPAVRAAIHQAYASNDKIYSLPWLLP